MTKTDSDGSGNGKAAPEKEPEAWTTAGKLFDTDRRRRLWLLLNSQLALSIIGFFLTVVLGTAITVAVQRHAHTIATNEQRIAMVQAIATRQNKQIRDFDEPLQSALAALLTDMDNVLVALPHPMDKKDFDDLWSRYLQSRRTEATIQRQRQVMLNRDLAPGSLKGKDSPSAISEYLAFVIMPEIGRIHSCLLQARETFQRNADGDANARATQIASALDACVKGTATWNNNERYQDVFWMAPKGGKGSGWDPSKPLYPWPKLRVCGEVFLLQMEYSIRLREHVVDELQRNTDFQNAILDRKTGLCSDTDKYVSCAEERSFAQTLACHLVPDCGEVTTILKPRLGHQWSDKSSLHDVCSKQ